ncbi:N-acetylglucosamine kinase [Siccirubricoccus deserti]|uniref:ROK family protein n=1 Tax=Siccirubricoccus deserti TaxID=2013562 RepID=A0A9X0QYN7_9PROT|nr:ROK family protein [Siccirubricoccus deserti]MBC4015077.1 ROK family protein [Siccirubricoccus deserti]GGC35804.1 N-acetylglucosamine kinase [Siccirubricoccus deserti]
MTLRFGIDLGGTKTEIVALDATGAVRLRQRAPTPPDYTGVIALIGELVEAAEARLGASGSVGIGIPGSLSPATGLVRGANSTWLNGGRLDRDIEARLGRPVRLSNDANCLAMSEAADGAGAGFDTVFAVILGTGVGAGIVSGGRVMEGRNRVAGEWGHNPLPWMTASEHPGPVCWCGRRGCIESFLCGPALAAEADGPGARDASVLPTRAAAGDGAAAAALARHTDRLARALAHVVNLLDPDCIVLGGGLSNMDHLYAEVPARWGRWIFSDTVTTPLRRAWHGDSSGVLGAARLWDAG